MLSKYFSKYLIRRRLSKRHDAHKDKWIVESEPSHNVQDTFEPKETSASYKDKWIVTPEPSHNAQDTLEPRDMLPFYTDSIEEPKLVSDAQALIEARLSLVRNIILKEKEGMISFDSDFHSNFIKTLPGLRSGMRSVFDLSGNWFQGMFDLKGLSDDEARKADADAMIKDYITAKNEFINSMKND